MKFLDTPKERFSNLPDYPFLPNFMEVGDGLKMHYLDEGKVEGEVVLLLHGEPSWSFLYRYMIPVFTDAGFRVIVPDLIGFGKSSKPVEQSDYTYARHIQWTKTLLDNLDLQAINFFGQDWGGLIGLRLVAMEPGRFARVVVANTGLPAGAQWASEAFLKWQKFSQTTPVFPTGVILQNATVTDLSPEVIAAYDAPFPDESYKAGARIFPSLVPVSDDDPEAVKNAQAWEVLKQLKIPFLTLFSDSDPITKGGEKIFQKLVPGTKSQPHQIIKGGGHFLQEDKGAEIAKLVVDFIKGGRKNELY